MRMSRWAKAGVLDAVFEQLQRQGLTNVRIEALSLDSTAGDAPEARPLIEAMDSHHDKTYVMFAAFITLAFIAEALR